MCLLHYLHNTVMGPFQNLYCTIPIPLPQFYHTLTTCICFLIYLILYPSPFFLLLHHFHVPLLTPALSSLLLGYHNHPTPLLLQFLTHFPNAVFIVLLHFLYPSLTYLPRSPHRLPVPSTLILLFRISITAVPAPRFCHTFLHHCNFYTVPLIR